MRRLWLVLALVVACDSGRPAAPGAEAVPEGAEPVEPPFAVRGDLSGLLLTYFDAEGPHRASSLAEVPTERRQYVVVDSLEIPPEQREPEHVYVADLRGMQEGRYPVHRYPRAAFDILVDRLTGVALPGEVPAGAVALAAAPVVVYGASWCSACRSAKNWLTQRGVPVEDRDIERDPGARAEMQAKARAQGVPTSGIPVIDVRGRLTTGFDPGTLERLLAETTPRTL
ncbi:MAG: glutaredoxin family protein [Sandaracinus sp.]|nr:glutaredoxin family protein [Myxococcales bacterium]MCB9603430.1 glutaredoxin family protein [Sandaracinus sp.]MCB9612205.1 glutaredoxin family protein [Sandaracinus sp.]MCB9618371.1 glutaredoxin family protein [Sandaracinus sp.]MCB9623057.1 glutaredoxin family protein [Sandaracinus sp.]